ncbi:MAG: RNA methyltransferase [Muribaculaceae bacterium]|nr:RNA methyltransferase [Muribaculaceae bacterium]
MNSTFEMVAKTFQGLENVLAGELESLGASDVVPGKRMVAFRGDLAMLYKANMCCRTALRILKPFYTFEASDADELYSKVKEYDWETLLSAERTFSIDTVAFSDEFKHSQFVTYRVKDAIVDWFRDRMGGDKRPGVRLDGADIMINVHINGRNVTLSLDSSGESLHKRGWRVASTEAPINEVLAAGIILMSGWDGSTPFVDPMCGSGTFAIEAAMIAAGIQPGVYRRRFAFEGWPDFNAELLDEIYNDDSRERTPEFPILACDISPKAIAIARENAKNAGVERYITFEQKSISKWEEAPLPAGTLVTNPPYGKRIGADDMNALYSSIGTVLKHVFKGWHAWIIGYNDEYFHEIGLAPSQKVAVNNGGLECELREYVIFEGSKRDFRAAGGRIKEEKEPERRKERPARNRDERGGRGERAPFKGKRDERGGKRGERPERGGRPERGERAPFKGKRGERPERRGEEGRRHRDEIEELGGRLRLRPAYPERKPSLGADKEIVINRPAWRKRKKDIDNNENTNQ